MYHILKLHRRSDVVLNAVIHVSLHRNVQWGASKSQNLPKFFFSGNKYGKQNTRWKRLWVKQTETCQDCTLSILLFSEVVRLKGLWLCICCWKHKDHMCALYPWGILLDDSCGLCKRATLCCSPAATLACDDNPHWLHRPNLFSVSPQHGNSDALNTGLDCKSYLHKV